MSIHSDIVTALAGITVFPQAAPQEQGYPFVVYRRVAVDPTTLIGGQVVSTESTVDFICVDDTLDGALSLADDVRTALNAAAGVNCAEQASSGDDYEPAVDAFTEVVRFMFWH